MATDPKTPTQPDAGPALTPVKSFAFANGMKYPLAGKRGVHGGMGEGTKTTPSPGEFWTIHHDPRGRRLVVAHFKPGTDLKRRPDDVSMIPESLVVWRPA